MKSTTVFRRLGSNSSSPSINNSALPELNSELKKSDILNCLMLDARTVAASAMMSIADLDPFLWFSWDDKSRSNAWISTGMRSCKSGSSSSLLAAIEARVARVTVLPLPGGPIMAKFEPPDRACVIESV